MKNRQWLLACRPHGAIQDSDFSFVETDSPIMTRLASSATSFGGATPMRKMQSFLPPITVVSSPTVTICAPTIFQARTNGGFTMRLRSVAVEVLSFSQ